MAAATTRWIPRTSLNRHAHPKELHKCRDCINVPRQRAQCIPVKINHTHPDSQTHILSTCTLTMHQIHTGKQHSRWWLLAWNLCINRLYTCSLSQPVCFNYHPYNLALASSTAEAVAACMKSAYKHLNVFHKPACVFQLPSIQSRTGEQYSRSSGCLYEICIQTSKRVP